jgi:hypothetical protein
VLYVFSLAQSQDTETAGIDPNALIERILTVDSLQMSRINDVTFDAEYIEGEEKDDGFKEKVRLVKRVYIKYFPDTAWYHEEYQEYYKDGKQKSTKDRDKEAAERKKKRKKRKSRDISFSMIEPFKLKNRDKYDVEYLGVADNRIDDYICHHFRITAKEELQELVNGDYYFEAGSFNLVRVQFSPAKLVKKTMFKMKKLNMVIRYGPSDQGLWLPIQFDVSGKGRAAFLFGVNFAGTEYFRNPVINSGLSDNLFKESGDE